MCAFSTCRICGRTGLAVGRAINVGCSCPISDLSIRQSQRPPPPPLRRAQGALMSHHWRRILWICGRRKKGRRPQTHRSTLTRVSNAPEWVTT